MFYGKNLAVRLPSSRLGIRFRPWRPRRYHHHAVGQRGRNHCGWADPRDDRRHGGRALFDLCRFAEEAEIHFEQITGPFSGIDLVLASHRHDDHNQPAFACDFMQNSRGSKLYTSAEVIGLMREKCRPFVTGSDRVVAVDPQPGAPVVIGEDGDGSPCSG